MGRSFTRARDYDAMGAEVARNCPIKFHSCIFDFTFREKILKMTMDLFCYVLVDAVCTVSRRRAAEEEGGRPYSVPT